MRIHEARTLLGLGPRRPGGGFMAFLPFLVGLVTMLVASVSSLPWWGVILAAPVIGCSMGVIVGLMTVRRP